MSDIKPGWPRAVLFDLDGTLIDSAPDIRAAVNELLATHGIAPVTLDQVRSFIGNGVKKLVERSFAATSGPLSAEALEGEYAAMMGIYGKHLTGLTTLLPGARDMLAGFHANGIRLGLVTNKPQRFIETILDHFSLSKLFGAAVGGDADVPVKPAPDMLFAAMQRLGASPNDAVMVGDSTSDVESAHAAGIPAVILRGGYTNIAAEQLGADALIDRLADLPQALASIVSKR
jgi:phosphoglycolate phosphatase